MKDALDQVFYYLDALWRRRWQVSGVAFMVAPLIWAYTASLPDQYTSSARIYVDTQNVLGPLLKGMTVDSNLDQQVEVMRQTLLSRPNIEEVARVTDMDIEAQTPAEMEGLINGLEQRITVGSDRQNLFQISYSGTDPQLAHDVVRALTTIFVENNLGRNQDDMDNAQSFLQRQIASYEEKLNAAERELSLFKQENLEFLPGQSGLQEALQQQESRLGQLRGQLKNALNKQEILEEEYAQTPEMLGASGLAGQGPPTQIDVQLMEARGELERLKARYTEQHPDVVTLQRRVDRLQRERDAQLSAFGPEMPAEDAEGGTVPNPIRGQLRMELIRTKSEIEALRDQIEQAEKSVNSIIERVLLVPEVEAKLNRLTRDYEMIRSNYESLLARQQSANMTEQREQEGNQFAFRMVEPPTVPQIPSGPNRALFLAFGFVASLAAGAGVAWLLALIKVTYGSAEHLRRDFDIPVIGAVTETHEGGGASLAGAGKVFGVSLMGLILLASLVALVYVESRFGLSAWSTQVYGYLGALFVIGAGVLTAQVTIERKRLFGRMGIGGGMSVQTS